MKAIRMKGPGGTEALEWVDLPVPAPGPGEALVEIAAAGVNFMDIGARRGVIWTDLPDPRILGVEGVLSQSCFFESFDVCKSLNLREPVFAFYP